MCSTQIYLTTDIQTPGSDLDCSDLDCPNPELPSPNRADSSNQADSTNHEVQSDLMCLVFSDGSVTTVDPQS